MLTKATENIPPRKIELVLAQLDALRPLAPIAIQALEPIEDSTNGSEQFIESIRSDLPLIAAILAVADTSETGHRAEARRIADVVNLLGPDTIRDITLVRKVIEAFGPAGVLPNRHGFDRQAFWRHSLAVAIAAKKLAGLLEEPVDSQMAFACGWLHDIGKMALSALMPKSFERIVRVADEKKGDIADVERGLLGIDHTIVGRRLAERWGLPSRLLECIRLHHQLPEALPPSVAQGGQVHLVRLADAIAREQRIGYSGNHRFATSSRTLAERLGVSESNRHEIADTLKTKVEARAAWIADVDAYTPSPYYLQALAHSTNGLAAANTELAAENMALKRQADYFAALRELTEAASPRASVRQACGAGAAALRQVLGAPAVVVFAVSEQVSRVRCADREQASRVRCADREQARVRCADREQGADPEQEAWFQVGFCDGSVTCALEPRSADVAGESEDAAAALEMARAGHWIAPPGRAFDGLVDRYRGMLGHGQVWLLPIVREDRWIGGALFSVPVHEMTLLSAETPHLRALATAVGRSIIQANAQAAATALGDELAEVNRRLLDVQGELLRTRNLETVVAMAAGAAHELNNPLAVISGRAQMLRNRTQDSEVRNMLDTISDRAQACSDIVTELMEFAQTPRPAPERVDLGGLLHVLMTELVSGGLLESDALRIEVASDTPPVRFDPTWLNRMFRELLQNAIDATQPLSRRLTVKAASHLTEDSVVVEVLDNGHGIPADVLGRVLDPFFSYRPAGRSRGLGLARVHRWLQLAGGAIRIESEPGCGTSVHLRLPRASPSAG